MSKVLNIRFQKFDKFDNPVFIASNEDPDYNILKKMSQKIDSLEYDSFSPLYHNDPYNYTTIRFMKSNIPVTLVKNNVYNIDYNVKQVTKNDRTFINCNINKIKLIKKAKVVDQGVDIDLF